MYSIIYGEGVFNDIVSIILFNTVSGFNENTEFLFSSPFKIGGKFLSLTVVSMAIGVGVGFISCLVFKYLRFLCHSAIIETSIIILVAMMSYYISESYEQ